MSKAKRYKIETLEQLLNIVTFENQTRLLIDFASYLMMYADMINKVRISQPNETKGKLNTEICESHFVWVDDGKEGVTSVEIINKQTGETKNIKVNK